MRGGLEWAIRWIFALLLALLVYAAALSRCCRECCPGAWLQRGVDWRARSKLILIIRCLLRDGYHCCPDSDVYFAHAMSEQETENDKTRMRYRGHWAKKRRFACALIRVAGIRCCLVVTKY